MRTPEQIKNLRKAMFQQYGPFIYLVDDTIINSFADRLQTAVDDIKYLWNIKIMFIDAGTKTWDDIIPEPQSYKEFTLAEIYQACYRLLKKYPNIDKIQITEFEHKMDIYYIRRQDLPN